MKKHITLYAVCLATFMLVFVGVFALWHIGERLLYSFFPIEIHHGNTILITGSIVLPAVLAFLSSCRIVRLLSKKWSMKLTPPDRAVISLLAITYLITGTIGSTAVQNYNDSWALSEFKRINTNQLVNLSETPYPYFRTFIAMPVVPFVVFSYHEDRLSDLYGWGGWDMQVWYLTGVKRLFTLTRWIS